MARVVIVDDSLLIRTQLRNILTAAGHEVVGEAEDGLRAPILIEELQPDLVTLDLVMPGRDGFATLRHLVLRDPTLPVLICSAHLTHASVFKALRLGARGYIAKPIRADWVLDSIDRALSWTPRAQAEAPDAAELPALAVA